MLKKHKLIKEILDLGVVAIVRTDSASQAEKIVEACLNGGLNAIEVTFTVDKAYKIIEQLSIKNQNKIILGAGTILDAETARIAILSGASYIVSPNFDIQTALLCNRYAIPYMAGCFTNTEIIRAMEYGVEIIKLFPASHLGSSIIKAIKAPLPQANIMPTGGINLQNAGEWIRAGAVALGVGGDLVAGASSGDFNLITQNAKKYREEISKARAINNK